MTHSKRRRVVGWMTSISCCILLPLYSVAFDDDSLGAVKITNLTVPLSDLMSPEARAYMTHLLVDHPFAGGPRADQDIKGYRARQDEIMHTFLDPMLARYAVAHRDRTIGGVVTDYVTPATGVAPRNTHRVLINLHGGGFLSGARTAALVESVPIAALMKIPVISVDYRLAPEAHFPAASEDVAAVYKELLKHFKPSQIGIYGCSAGGILAAESIAWFATHHLPLPAALGVLCASLGEDFSAGDSGVITWQLNGFPQPPNGAKPLFRTGYFEGVTDGDPLARPVYSPALLANFPPTIFLTATRSMEFSAAVHSHNALLQAGVKSELNVWDGLPHAFMYNSDLPESRQAYDILVKFFDEHLSP